NHRTIRRVVPLAPLAGRGGTQSALAAWPLDPKEVASRTESATMARSVEEASGDAARHSSAETAEEDPCGRGSRPGRKLLGTASLSDRPFESSRAFPLGRCNHICS